MSKFIFFISALFLSAASLAQNKIPVSTSSKPKLIVGIVVDQMRNDYITRYWDRYSKGGFKRLVEGGFYFKNTHYNYTPTYTGPGHASVFTGTTPRFHGIIGNDWFLKQNNSNTYCASDTSMRTVGASGKAGCMSPKNEMSSTIGDEMKTNSNNRSKVFAIALKDRAAVLPAGHAANGAFWLDDASGNFISSSWYMNELPQWLQDFNKEKKVQKYLEKGWSTLYPINTYTNSTKDSTLYEGEVAKMPPVFPYNYANALAKNNFGIIKASPFGNSISAELAMACIHNEQMGKDDQTDLLCLSFSSTDYVGHTYGIRSVETEDTYLRLDKEIETLLNFLDKEIGIGNYLVFLTADHGAGEVPAYLADQKIPGGILNENDLRKKIKAHFYDLYKDSTILASLSNEQIFLNETKLKALQLSTEMVEKELVTFLEGTKGIAEAYTSNVLKNTSFPLNDVRSLLQNGYNHKLSGNVAYVFEPGWIDHGNTGTTHGSGYSYDTHIPLLFFGTSVKKGDTFSYSTITQIAPTITELLKISRPNACTSEPLNNYWK